MHLVVMLTWNKHDMHSQPHCLVVVDSILITGGATAQALDPINHIYCTEYFGASKGDTPFYEGVSSLLCMYMYVFVLSSDVHYDQW